MGNILCGWLGYGTSLSTGFLVEPSDVNYSRRPIAFGLLDRGTLADLLPGTVGPASVAWGTIAFIGIFDAPVGGNLLLWLPTSAPVQVGIGGSITAAAGSLRMLFPDLAEQNRVRSWPTGSLVATTANGQPVTVGVPLQFSGGTLSAQAPTFGTTVLMNALPQTQPTGGTGQIWNNGGVISIA